MTNITNLFKPFSLFVLVILLNSCNSFYQKETEYLIDAKGYVPANMKYFQINPAYFDGVIYNFYNKVEYEELAGRLYQILLKKGFIYESDLSKCNFVVDLAYDYPGYYDGYNTIYYPRLLLYAHSINSSISGKGSISQIFELKCSCPGNWKSKDARAWIPSLLLLSTDYLFQSTGRQLSYKYDNEIVNKLWDYYYSN